MKGTIIEFLTLASETPALSQELVDLAKKYGFEFTDEVSDQELDSVAGGAAPRNYVKLLWTPPAPITESGITLSAGDESASSSGTASSSTTDRTTADKWTGGTS